MCTSVRLGLGMLLALSWITGCASTGDVGQADTVTAQVGNYAPPPSGIQKAKVGVPPFSVETSGGYFGRGNPLDEKAADQMSSLLHQSRRFEVIERAQLEQLLREQNMEGIVRPGELAKPGQVHGVDYLLLGKVTNFRVRADQTERGVGVGGGGGVLSGVTRSIGNAGFKKKEQQIVTECGVDIRLVDPTTGAVAVAHFGEFKRIDSASGMGISIGGISTSGDANVQIASDDAGKILRLAFDEALRKMLPEIDQVLQNRGTARRTEVHSVTVGTGETAASPPADQAGQPAAANKFCGQCGKQMLASANFCPSCGAKTE